MLYELIVLFLCILVGIMPFITLKVLKTGYKLAEKPETAEEPVFNMPKVRRRPKMDRDTQVWLEEMTNINNYDGTGFGQKEIKHE